MILRLIVPSLLFALVSTSLSVASAAPLTNRDLRRFGYIGYYRGDVQGTITVRDDDDDDDFETRLIDQTGWERLPARGRSVVTGPSGRNGFYLNLRSVTGNDRRIQVRLVYSGISYNPDYEEDMAGSGTKTLTVVRRGSRREMTLTDKLYERAVNGGATYTYWNVRGFLFK